MINKTDKQKILDLLKESEITTLQIEEKLGLSIDIIRTNVWRLRQENKIKEIGKDGKFKIYTAIKTVDPIILLKQLNKIMIEYMKPIKRLPEDKLELIDKIGELTGNE